MSLTQIDINILKASDTPDPLFVESRVRFHQQCVVNEHAIIDLYNVFWILKGKARIRIDFNEFDIAENTLFFLLPGQVFTVISENRLEGYRVAFESDFYCLSTNHPEIGCNGILFKRFNISPLLHISREVASEFENVFQNLEQSVIATGLAQSEIIQSYLKIFLIRCADLKRQELSSIPREEDDSLTWLSRFTDLIEKNFKTWHGVAEYAGALNLSPKTLTKKLARYGQTPSHLIQDRLVLESKRMLYYSQKTAKEVAYELGFDDPSYFSRFFKLKVGVSPGEFSAKARG